MSFFETFNLAKVKGNDIDTGSGAVSAATIRVILATDQATLPISAASLPLPTGAATSANQTTIIGHIDGIETLLGTSNTNTGAAATSLAIIDDWDESDRAKVNPIVGQAGVDGGSGNISDKTLRVTMADNDQMSSYVGDIASATDTIATILTDSYGVIDQASDGTESGIRPLIVRKDTPANLSGTDGDFEFLQMSAGRLWTSSVITGTVAVTQSGTWDEVGINDSGNSITIDAPVGTPAFVRLSDGAAAITTLPVSLATVPSHAVTNAGTFVVQENGAALTSLQLIDDGVATTGSAITAKGMAAVGTDGTNARILKTDASGELQVDVLTVPSDPFGANADAASATGSISAKLRFIANTGIPITGTVTVGSHAVTNAGTFAVQVDGSALTALQLIDDPVIADDAGFMVGTSKVMMSGHQAVAMGSNPDAADALDAVAGIANRHRVPYMIGGHPNIINKHIQVTDADGAQTDTALVTVGAGAKIVVTRYSVTVDSATTATGGVAVRMGFGTANTPSNDANSGVLMAHSGIPAGGGIAEGNGGGIIGMGADNEDLRLTCEDPAGGNIDIVVSYYTIES